MKREYIDIPDREGMIKRKVFKKDGQEYVEGDVIKSALRYVKLSNGETWDRAYSPKGKEIDAKEAMAYRALERAERAGFTKRDPEAWGRLKKALSKR